MKTSYCYWAGPRESAGPRPHSACAAQAKGKSGGLSGASAHGLLAQLSRGEGRSRRRRDVVAARLGRRAGGHCRPGQGKRASAWGSQGVGECEQANRKGEGGEEG